MRHPCTYIFAYLSGFKKGGRGRSESRGVCNLIYRSLFYYSAMFPSKRREGDSKREGETERGGEGGGWREMLALPFARVFKTDPTLVIYKILKKTLIL